jgi:hypothetical protein
MLLDINGLSEKYFMLLDIKDLSSLKTPAAVLVSLSFLVVPNNRQVLNVIRSQLLLLHKSFGDFSFTPSVPFQGRGSIVYPKYQAHGLLRLGNSTRTTGSFTRNMVRNYFCTLFPFLDKQFKLKQIRSSCESCSE